MIDRIDFVIHNLYYLDIKRLAELGIGYAVFSYKDYLHGWKRGPRFNYKNIEFKFKPTLGRFEIVTNTHKVLGKRDTSLSDKKEYITKVNEAVNDIFGKLNVVLVLDYIEFYVDVYVGAAIPAYIKMLKGHKSAYRYIKKVKDYETSHRLGTRYSQYSFIFYDRFAKTGEEEDRGVLRLEVQVKKRKLKKEMQGKKEKKSRLRLHRVNRKIESYWKKDRMEELFFDFLKGYLYEGDYYDKKKINQVINNSNMSDNWKKKLKSFTLMIQRYGLNGVVKRKKCCADTVNTYIQILQELGINPMPIPKGSNYKHLENLLPMARRVAEEKYFK